MNKSTERFTQTVQDYIKYRPSYPKEVLQLLIDECDLRKGSIVADVGSGTGLLSKLFLDYGNSVYGVEPNQSMREAVEEYLKKYSNFHSISGSAEATSLPKQSVDIVTAGTDYKESNAIKFNKTAVEEFFSPNEMKTHSFKNIQQFDWNGLKGRLLSTSYSLRPSDGCRYEEMLNALKEIFDRYQKNGIIEFLYDTKLNFGRIHAKFHEKFSGFIK